MRAQLIKTNGEITDVVPENSKYFGLEQLYGLLNCELVEIISLPRKQIMIMDEEGKLKDNYKINEVATSMSLGHIIVGDVIVCDSGMFE